MGASPIRATRGDFLAGHTKTKAKKDRRVPISSVLRDVPLSRRHDPAGAVLAPEAYVFGDEVGRRRHAIKDAWTRVLTRAAITGLHFHDLHREAGSRWMDAGSRWRRFNA